MLVMWPEVKQKLKCFTFVHLLVFISLKFHACLLNHFQDIGQSKCCGTPCIHERMPRPRSGCSTTWFGFWFKYDWRQFLINTHFNTVLKSQLCIISISIVFHPKLNSSVLGFSELLLWVPNKVDNIHILYPKEMCYRKSRKTKLEPMKSFKIQHNQTMHLLRWKKPLTGWLPT